MAVELVSPGPADEGYVLQCSISEVELPLEVPHIDVALDLFVEGVRLSCSSVLIKHLQDG